MIRREAFEPLPKGDLQDLGLSSAANNCNRLFSFPVFNFAQRDEEVSPAAKPEAELWLTEARSPASTHRELGAGSPFQQRSPDLLAAGCSNRLCR